ncbi:ankyrin repeat and IBR domain-containing protein 1-like [Sitophilus oryzae]|uniref:Ankyrin repeat and IBR domain-containing protein 1-like n=1 Tax=Sitophilus oryzae TaxID=7048 RepID=A0A6J2Y7I1_SITOR|nr:ankyrin repeat and IBR domain-containing protein 1-like [Sitophilus oryzae]
MGSTSSKFKKNLQHGDEYAAMKIYQNTPELRKYFNPNSSYGESHHHNTSLHYAAKHGMKHLLRAFLNDLGGNPNKKNIFNETVLHCACHIIHNTNYSAQDRRAACVQLLIHWRGSKLSDGNREKIDLSAQDQVK